MSRRCFRHLSTRAEWVILMLVLTVMSTRLLCHILFNMTVNNDQPAHFSSKKKNVPMNNMMASAIYRKRVSLWLIPSLYLLFVRLLISPPLNYRIFSSHLLFSTYHLSCDPLIFYSSLISYRSFILILFFPFSLISTPKVLNANRPQFAYNGEFRRTR